jgi:Bacterial Ig-like domain (group 2)/Abnormal spindle-like microcephaly-assoc'd, ASPM-SPD-2-Hydin/Galactose oxidase, central domain/Kelch motif
MASGKRALRPPKSKSAKSHKHPESESLMRPEVGTQAQFKKKLPPKTYRYDSSFSPALGWDGKNPAREHGEALIQQGLDAKTLEEAKAAASKLKAMSKPFLNWAGKAERLSFDVPTLPLFIHERLSTKEAGKTSARVGRRERLESVMRRLFFVLSCAAIAIIFVGCGGGSSQPVPPPQVTATTSTTSMTFGSTIVGASSTSQSLTLTNNSETPLNISIISASGPFSQSNNCPASLSANAFCTIVVIFSPTTTGTATGSINVIDNASNSPQTVSLSGTGIAPPTTLSPTSLTFGGTSAGTTSAAQPLSLKNNLTTSVGISVTVSGPFSQTNNCPASLTANASCTINVTFAPTMPGVSTGNVAVVNNVSNSAVTSTLSGTGTAGFVSTGSMVVGRYLHTATLLNNGQVLIAGGENSTGSPIASAELYNPATGTFTTTGSMTTVRYRHAATLLTNGWVLITGGENSNNGTLASSFLANAELYNPATGTFTTTGSMTTSRRWHTATLLPNGKVLVVGGGNLVCCLASAELYDPTSGTFTATGSMSNPREEHTATLLNNGTVLIAGGSNGAGGVNGFVSAEIYNPTNGTFVVTGSPNTARSGHTAILLNSGKVLIATGYIPGGSELTSAELYDPITGMFAFTGSLNTAREFHKATLLNNGTVLTTGGLPGPTGIAELYNSGTGAFTLTASMNPNYWHTATLLNTGNVLIAGGNTFTPALGELYLPDTLAPAGLVSITVTPTASTVSVGTTQQFIATGTFSDNSTQVLQSVIWSSSNASVAAISNDASNHGTALALASGTSTITASAGPISGSTALSVH